MRANEKFATNEKLTCYRTGSRNIIYNATPEMQSVWDLFGETLKHNSSSGVGQVLVSPTTC